MMDCRECLFCNKENVRRRSQTQEKMQHDTGVDAENITVQQICDSIKRRNVYWMVWNCRDLVDRSQNTIDS